MTQQNHSMAAVIKGSRVLIQHRYRSENGMAFEFPGGPMNTGETAEESAKRVLLEETGICGELVFTTAQYVSLNEDDDIIFYIVLSAAESVEPMASVPDGRQEFHWFELNEIPRNDFFPADIKFIETELINHI